ncbi:MAG: hypothetical protein KGL39_16515 [Patescibacteria group bacterium]|nr:hypothetical protein [Patescibacteria group bacterium]
MAKTKKTQAPDLKTPKNGHELVTPSSNPEAEGLLTAKHIASELHISARQFRAFLRSTLGGYDDRRYTRYGFTRAQADKLKEIYLGQPQKESKAKLTAEQKRDNRKARAARRRSLQVDLDDEDEDEEEAE